MECMPTPRPKRQKRARQTVRKSRSSSRRAAHPLKTPKTLEATPVEGLEPLPPDTFEKSTITVEKDKPTTIGELTFPKTTRLKRTARWPKDWWNAVWERFAPAWALAKWPTEWEVLDYTVEVDGTPVPILQTGLVQQQDGSVVQLPYTDTPEKAKAAGKQILEEERKTPLWWKQKGWDDRNAGRNCATISPEFSNWASLSYDHGWIAHVFGKSRPTE